jgi:Domain of unknown function (DUF4124)
MIPLPLGRIAAALCTIAIAGSVRAQAVYKTVGPDGKIIYSDQPPADNKSKATTLGTPAPRSQSAPVKEAAAVTDAKEPTKMMGAKKAIRTDTAQAEAPRSDAAAVAATALTVKVDPAVEKALIGVLGLEDLVTRTEDICVRNLPTSMKKYSAATTQWKDRNATVVTKSHRVLSDLFDASQRQLISAGVKAKSEQLLASVVAAPMASKIKWCDQSAGEINSGAMDVYNKPNLATPLISYSAK